jgi:hypothetical protein
LALCGYALGGVVFVSALEELIGLGFKGLDTDEKDFLNFIRVI